MWIAENLVTKLSWEIADEAMAKRLAKDEDYEVTEVVEEGQDNDGQDDPAYRALKSKTVAQLVEQYGEKVPGANNLKKDELIRAILALPAE